MPATPILSLGRPHAVPVRTVPKERLSLQSVQPIISVNPGLHVARENTPRSGEMACSILEIGRHTSELQSRLHPVCRLLLEKKQTNPIRAIRLTRESRFAMARLASAPDPCPPAPPHTPH